MDGGVMGGAHAGVPGDEAEPQIELRQIMGPLGRLRIRHGDQVYVLRLTRAGKLLLTK